MNTKESNTPLPYIQRDISWLSFNARVLQEAKNLNNPLLERLKFVAIFSNNLEEFFRIRVAHYRNLIRVGKKTKSVLSFDPKQTLKEIKKIVNLQQEEASQIFESSIVPKLKSHGIILKNRTELSIDQKVFVRDFFHNHLLPYVQPVLLMKGKVQPFLNNGALYLIVVMKEKQSKDLNSAEQAYGLVKVPSDHENRFIPLPSENPLHFEIILLDNIVRESLNQLFPGFQILNSYSIKLTRDAELYIDDEFQGDLLEKIRKSLQKRQVGPASRLVFDRSMSEADIEFLKEIFDISNLDLFPEGTYHNKLDFFKFPGFGKKELSYPPFPPLAHNEISASNSIFDAIQSRDQVIFPPYHSYEPVIQFFESSAIDPLVKTIKITQYRIANNSRIMDALMQAAENKKEVVVFIEVKARFSEEVNLAWGERLQKAGVKVIFSFPGLKVHAKCAMVTRKENQKLVHYSYVSTGNFNEITAFTYCDIGIFTKDERITIDINNLFNYLEHVKVPPRGFQHVLVGQFNLQEKLYELFDEEMRKAQSKVAAGIFFKLNSIEDPEMIGKIYQASKAGVKVRLIIRGICCLVPGIKSISENVEIISIVDRFLEHSRVFIFGTGKDVKIFISSADLMTRNLYYRIETIIPVYDPKVHAAILHYCELQWKDNTRARIIDSKLRNRMVKAATHVKPVRSQFDFYQTLKQQMQRS